MKYHKICDFLKVAMAHFAWANMAHIQYRPSMSNTIVISQVLFFLKSVQNCELYHVNKQLSISLNITNIAIFKVPMAHMAFAAMAHRQYCTSMSHILAISEVL